MKNSLISLAGAAAITLVSTAAFADSDRCTVPMAEWQPKENLQKMLEAEGWQVKRIKTDDGCYEAYAFDKDGKRVEAYFDPKTLKQISSKSDD